MTSIYHDPLHFFVLFLFPISGSHEVHGSRGDLPIMNWTLSFALFPVSPRHSETSPWWIAPIALIHGPGVLDGSTLQRL
jgi:hypothetical protein